VRRVGQVSGKNLILPRPVGISKANPPVEAKKLCVFVQLCLRSANVAELYSGLPVKEVDDSSRIMTAVVICGAGWFFCLDSLESLATSFPNNLADAHCRQAVKTTSSGAYTPVIIHRTLQKNLWRRLAPCCGTFRWSADQTQRTNVRTQERRSDVVPLTFGSETYPTNAGGFVVFVEVSTGAAADAPMKRRQVNRSGIDSDIRERKMDS
jgi:hypothetical protein